MIETRKIEEVICFRMGRTLLGRGWYHTAAYLVDGLMVDTGCAHTVEELMAALGPHAVHTVVNTHSHEDHVAGDAEIRRARRARILAHPLALPLLAMPPERRPEMQPYRRIFWGAPEPCEAEPVGEWVHTERFRFRVLHTPGHSLDHICLHEPDRGWLLVGDAFVGGMDRALRRDSDVWRIIESMRHLAGLDARLMMPGSGTVYEDPSTVLRRKIDYLEEAGQRVLDLHRRGVPEPGIYREVFGRQPLIALFTRQDFDGPSLVRSFLRATSRGDGTGAATDPEA